jgi:hypothetical protein
MKWILLVFALTLIVNSQSTAAKHSEQGESTVATKMDPKLHADAVALVEVSGARQHLKDNFKQMVDQGAKQIMEKCQR